MKVLIIPSWYKSKYNPMSGIFFKEQAEALAKYGHEVTVINVNFLNRNDVMNGCFFHKSHTIENNVSVYSLNVANLGLLSKILPLAIFVYKTLLFHVFNKLRSAGHRFDIVHAHSFFLAGYCSAFLSQKFNIPLVCTEHSSAVPQKLLTKGEIKLLTKTVDESSKFICVSNGLRNAVEQHTGIKENVIVIPNIVSPIFKYSGKAEKDKTTVCFLSIGGLIERKRYAFMIDCFNAAFSNKEDVQLKIAGEGELKGELEKQIKKLKRSDIILLGQLDRENIKREIEESDIFVLVSSNETFGVVYVEAMACGRPVIATRNGGADDIVNEDNGVLIEVDNQKQLVETFRYMYNNLQKYDGEQIAASCYTLYSEKLVVESLTKIYNQKIESVVK